MAHGGGGGGGEGGGDLKTVLNAPISLFLLLGCVDDGSVNKHVTQVQHQRSESFLLLSFLLYLFKFQLLEPSATCPNMSHTKKNKKKIKDPSLFFFFLLVSLYFILFLMKF